MILRCIVAVPLALVGALWFLFLALPWPIALRWRAPDRTAFMEYRLKEAETRGVALEFRYDWVPLERISEHLRRAVIVAEDARFYEHRGVDWSALREEFRYEGDAEFTWTDSNDLRALMRSIRYYRTHSDKVRGRSTITQQLAKNLYFRPDRSLLRKAEEFLVARRLERFLGKDRILELYLNTAEWGSGIFGAEAAARHYFGRSAADLTRSQAATLAATLPHPLTSNPKHRPKRMEWRRDLILSRMGGSVPAPEIPLEALPRIEPVAPVLGDPAPRPVGAPAVHGTEPDTSGTAQQDPTEPQPIEGVIPGQ